MITVCMEFWVKQFNDRGFVSVMDRPRAGRPSRISDEVMDRIHKNLRRDP
jgi:transposase